MKAQQSISKGGNTAFGLVHDFCMSGIQLTAKGFHPSIKTVLILVCSIHLEPLEMGDDYVTAVRLYWIMWSFRERNKERYNSESSG